MYRNLFPSILILALVVGGSAVWLQSQGTPDTGSTELAELNQLIDVTDVQATDGETPELIEMTMGDENAPVTVVEYASFTCPHCATFHINVFGELKTNYVDTGKVKFIMRDVYFDRLGLWAAMLARCEGPDKFFGVSDLIYKRQREWTSGGSNAEIEANLKKLGRIAGMNDEAMDACMRDGTKAQALADLFQENVARDGVESTPTFLINGKLYSNMNYTDFKDVLDGLLPK